MCAWSRHSLARPHETQRFARANDSLIERMTEAVRSGARTTPIMMLTLEQRHRGGAVDRRPSGVSPVR